MRRSGVFIVNFKYILHLVLNFLSLTWNMYCASLAIYKSCVSTANFQQVNAVLFGTASNIYDRALQSSRAECVL